MADHISADGHPVEVGKKFWNNDLRVCRITAVATSKNDYQDGRATQTWHDADCGNGRESIFDTLTGDLSFIGRLTRYFQGFDAENYEPGTNYSDVKQKGARGV